MHSARRNFIGLLLFSLILLSGSGCHHIWKPLPEGLAYHGPARPAGQIDLLIDTTFVTPEGQRRSEQEIFDGLFRLINQAEKLLVLDLFLYNEFAGKNGSVHRRLCDELTTTLIQRKKAVPDMVIVLITDPVNTVYGGLEARHLTRLGQAGIEVVETNLDRLRDSNPLWSSPWRLLIKPWGNSMGSGTAPSPFGPEKVTWRSWLRLLNFKANHRKVAVMDSGDDWIAWVSSANPHDGSSAHGNVALVFTGPAALDVLTTEKAVLGFSSAKPDILAAIDGLAPLPCGTSGTPHSRLEIITEGRIGAVAENLIAQSKKGDHLDLVMFYLSDRGIVKALKKARRRGVSLRVILDPNKDAFGRIKKGVPNRPVGRELFRAGIPVRWAATHGEQAHAKVLLVNRKDGSAALCLGSANYTRRNLRNYNLETNVLHTAQNRSAVMRAANDYTDRLWSNRDGQIFTTGYESYRDDSLWKRIRYRLQEATGLCTW